MRKRQHEGMAGMIREMGIVRSADLEARGISRKELSDLVRLGLVQREARGVYVASGHEVTENYSLALVAKRVPTSVVSLLTALRFHELTTQNPSEVWITLPGKARRPRLEYPRIRVMRSSGPALTSGVETHRIEGVDVRVYSAAKTVVDCFKYRNRVGLDIALEAMWDGWRSRKYTMDEITRFGRICRVERVMLPYLQAMVA